MNAAMLFAMDDNIASCCGYSLECDGVPRTGSRAEGSVPARDEWSWRVYSGVGGPYHYSRARTSVAVDWDGTTVRYSFSNNTMASR